MAEELGGLIDIAEDLVQWLDEHPTITLAEALKHVERDAEQIKSMNETEETTS